MARIRTIKPAAFTSETLSTLPREMRWTFAGLWTYVDDEGRGRCNPRLIKAELFPLDDDVDAETIEVELSKFEGAGLICRYESAGRTYFHVVNLAEHQKINRPTPSTLPACPVHTHTALTEESVKPQPKPTEDSLPEGKGKEGKGSTSSRSRDERLREYDTDPDFLRFWEIYPRKVGKPAAFKAWKAALKRGDDPEHITTAAAAYRDDPKRKPDYTKHPGPWLNEERYNVEDDEPATHGGFWNA